MYPGAMDVSYDRAYSRGEGLVTVVDPGLILAISCRSHRPRAAGELAVRLTVPVADSQWFS